MQQDPAGIRPEDDQDLAAAALLRSGDRDAAFAAWERLEQDGTASRSFRDLIEDLLRTDGFDLAVDLLDEGARRLPLSAEDALRQMLRCAQWLAHEGYMRDAAQLMDRLIDGETQVARRRDLFTLFHIRVKDLDPDSLSRTIGWVGRGSTKLLIRRILYLLASNPETEPQFRKAADRSLRLARTWKPPKRAELLRHIALPLLVQGETDRLVTIAEAMPAEMEETAARFPLLAGWLRDHLTRLGRPVPDRMNPMLRVHDIVEQGTRAVLARLADPAVRVAVVGNSPCEIGTGKGAEIDAHDLVIRFNQAPLYPVHADDYGRRTNIHVLSRSALERVAAHLAAAPTVEGGAGLPGALWLSWAPEQKPLRRPIDDLHRRGMLIAQTPAASFRELRGLLHSSPSSGLQVLHAIHRARGSFDNVGLYGFAFTDQIGPERVSSNYFRQSSPSMSHNWPGEAEIVAALRAGVRPEPQTPKTHAPAMPLLVRGAFRPLRFRLIGDHAGYHCGSAAVTDWLTGMLREKGVLVTDDSYDVLVVNGEGTMHHDSKGQIRKMTALARAQELGRSTMLVNSVWQQNDGRFDEVLRRIDHIVLREVLSQKDLLERHGVPAKVSPDVSYHLKLAEPGQIVDCSGGLALTDFYSREFSQFVRLTGGRLIREATFLSMQELDWSSLVHSLKTASLLVTGRHHAVYAACRAGIPFVAVPGNTHKIEGLIASAGVDIPLCRDPSELPWAIARAQDNPEPYRELFAWLRDQLPLTVPNHLLFRTADGQRG